MLKRHLMTHYNMTPDQYRQKWGLTRTIRWSRPIMPNNGERWQSRSAWARSGGEHGGASKPSQMPGAGTYFDLMTRTIDIEALCADKGLRITEQRKVIARVLGDSDDHPDVETLHARAAAIDPNISIATVYRTVRLFEEAGILERHEFGDGRSRYEAASESHHDHLIDVETGNVIEFVDDELEALQKRIAEKLGFRLVDHRMELYGVAARPRSIERPPG